MRIIDRFLQYIEHKGISENKATIDCGLSQGLLHQAKSGKSDLGHKSIDKISKQYQDLNISWLRTGEPITTTDSPTYRYIFMMIITLASCIRFALIWKIPDVYLFRTTEHDIGRILFNTALSYEAYGSLNLRNMSSSASNFCRIRYADWVPQ